MVVLDQNGAIISTAAAAIAATAIQLVQGTVDDVARVSDIIRKKDVMSFLSGKFTNRQEIKVGIGYNGTTGSIDVVASNVYSVELDHKYKEDTSPAAFTTRIPYESPSTSATQYKVARGLAQLLARTYNQFSTGTVRVGVISSSAITAANTILGCEVLYGDKVLTYTSFEAATPLVGSVVAIPGVTGAAHRDEDTTFYEIAYIDTVNKFIELDRPYMNRSQTAIAVEPVTNPTTGNWGLTLEGNSPSNFKKDEAMFMVDFDVNFTGFNESLETKAENLNAALIGFGRHEAVGNAEYWHQGEEGRNYAAGREYENLVEEFSVGHGYSKISIRVGHEEKINTLETNGQIKEFDIWLDRNTYALIAANHADTAFGTCIQVGTGLDAVDGDGVLNVLNAFMVSAGVIATGANTASNGGKSITPGTTYTTGIDV